MKVLVLLTQVRSVRQMASRPGSWGRHKGRASRCDSLSMRHMRSSVPHRLRCRAPQTEPICRYGSNESEQIQVTFNHKKYYINKLSWIVKRLWCKNLPSVPYYELVAIQQYQPRVNCANLAGRTWSMRNTLLSRFGAQEWLMKRAMLPKSRASICVRSSTFSVGEKAAFNSCRTPGGKCSHTLSRYWCVFVWFYTKQEVNPWNQAKICVTAVEELITG